MKTKTKKSNERKRIEFDNTNDDWKKFVIVQQSKFLLNAKELDNRTIRCRWTYDINLAYKFDTKQNAEYAIVAIDNNRTTGRRIELTTQRVLLDDFELIKIAYTNFRYCDIDWDLILIRKRNRESQKSSFNKFIICERLLSIGPNGFEGDFDESFIYYEIDLDQRSSNTRNDTPKEISKLLKRITNKNEIKIVSKLFAI